jgi:NIF3 (NGG1p interacting factor 3)
MSQKTATVADVLNALDKICAGRLIKRVEDAFGQGNPFVVVKTSHLPGKAVTETPGLVVGSPEQPVRKLAVSMTLTESQIELAGATGVDAIVCHHPVADAASSGGVPLRGYAGLYNLAVFEAHEAFHGRHPGIAYIHGHKPFRVEIAYGGLPGNIMYVGQVLEEVKTVGDIMERLARFCDLEREESFLELERRERDCTEIQETCVAVSPQILCGSREARVNQVVHFFPHTGFTPEHLRQVKREHPEIDTAIVSISRVKADHPLVQTARELGLNLIAGNSHALEILENGLPLAFALQELLPGVEVSLFRERVTSIPVSRFGSETLRQYGRTMAGYLVK